jgi:RNA-directed DNA polymerase
MTHSTPSRRTSSRAERKCTTRICKGYFDSIPRDKLTAGLETRIADRAVLKLIRMWFNSPVIEEDDEGRKTGHRPTQGVPQGGVISPILANAFLHWFDRAFHGAKGPAAWAKASLVRYAFIYERLGVLRL